MELTAWTWMLISVWEIAIVSILSLALLNFPGDKKPREEGVLGLAIPGKLRVIIEVGTATIGLIITVFINPLVTVLQLIITIVYLRTDSPRLSWMWGWSTYPPEYVTELHRTRSKNQVNKG